MKILSINLPKDHWSIEPGSNEPPAGMRVGTDDQTRKDLAEKVKAAAQYAYRASTYNGSLPLDPDALVQNMIVGLLGYWTPDGKSRL